MGGCMTAMALAKGAARIDGAMFSAPMLGIAGEHMWAIRMLVWLADKLGGARHYSLAGSGHPFDATFEANALTHDRARFERSHALILAHRELALGPVTWGWIESAFVALRRLERSPAIARLAIPVVVIAAGQESLVDIAYERRFAATVPHGRYLEIPHARHEILMETDEVRAIFWKEFDALASKLAPQG
jgi:lysophospholipase